MADQDLEYRLKIDTSDLASQLQQVRAQIDQALGAQVFNTITPSTQPAAFAFPMQQALANAQISLGQDINNTISAAQNAQNDVHRAMQSMRLGFQKFNNDVMTSYLSQVDVPMFASAQGAPIPSFHNRGVFQNLTANVIGLGYDPSMSLTPGEFRRRAGYEFANQSGRLTFGIGGSMLGGIAGSLTPIPFGSVIGTVLGGMVGDMAYDVAGTTILRDYEQASAIRDFAYNTSWRTFAGRFTRQQALQIGQDLSTVARSEALVGYGVTNTDVQRVMQEYTAIGGFDTVRSAEEYRTRAKDMIENHRKVMQILRLTEEDALQYMNTMQMYGRPITGNSAIGTATMAYAAGYTPKEFMSFAQQAAEMVRGTGINLGSAFAGGMDALLRTKSFVEAGTVPMELIQQYGGIQQYTLNTTRMGYEWANSMNGFTRFAAGMTSGGLMGTVGMSPQEAIGTAVANLSAGGIEGILGMQGRMGKLISNENPTVLAAMRGLDIASVMKMLNINPTMENFMGFAQTTLGVSLPDAESSYRMATGGATVNIAKLRNTGYQTAVDMAPSTLAQMSDRFTNVISNTMAATGNFLGLPTALRGLEQYAEKVLGNATLREPDYITRTRTSAINALFTGIDHERFDDLQKVLGSEKAVVDLIYASENERKNILESVSDANDKQTTLAREYFINRNLNKLRQVDSKTTAAEKTLQERLAEPMTQEKMQLLINEKLVSNIKDFAKPGMTKGEATRITQLYNKTTAAQEEQTVSDILAGPQVSFLRGIARGLDEWGLEREDIASRVEVSKTFRANKWLTATLNRAGAVVARGAAELIGRGTGADTFNSQTSDLLQESGISAEKAKVDDQLKDQKKVNDQLDLIAKQMKQFGAIGMTGGLSPEATMQAQSNAAQAAALKEIITNTATLKKAADQATGYINVKVHW
jgi:hypothetical protein